MYKDTERIVHVQSGVQDSYSSHTGRCFFGDVGASIRQRQLGSQGQPWQQSGVPRVPSLGGACGACEQSVT